MYCIFNKDVWAWLDKTCMSLTDDNSESQLSGHILEPKDFCFVSSVAFTNPRRIYYLYIRWIRFRSHQRALTYSFGSSYSKKKIISYLKEVSCCIDFPISLIKISQRHVYQCMTSSVRISLVYTAVVPLTTISYIKALCFFFSREVHFKNESKKNIFKGTSSLLNELRQVDDYRILEL